MSHDPMQHVLHALGHSSRHEREKGHTKRANGLILIGMGLVLLPIPIIGLPLIVWGVCNCFREEDSKESLAHHSGTDANGASSNSTSSLEGFAS